MRDSNITLTKQIAGTDMHVTLGVQQDLQSGTVINCEVKHIPTFNGWKRVDAIGQSAGIPPNVPEDRPAQKESRGSYQEYTANFTHDLSGAIAAYLSNSFSLSTMPTHEQLRTGSFTFQAGSVNDTSPEEIASRAQAAVDAAINSKTMPIHGLAVMKRRMEPISSVSSVPCLK